MARTELRNHAKFKRLVKCLNLPAPYVMGLLETMWHQGYETGNTLLGKPDDVELAAEWPGERGVFFRAIKRDWIDKISSDWHIHDLADHAPEYVQKKLARRINKLQQKTADIGGHLAEVVGETAENVVQTSNRHRQVTDTDTQRGILPGFASFWDSYPDSGKSSRKKALAQWTRAKLEPQAESVLSGVARWKKSRRWADGFVKGADLFLRDEMYLENPPQAAGDGRNDAGIVVDPPPRTPEEADAILKEIGVRK